MALDLNLSASPFRAAPTSTVATPNVGVSSVNVQLTLPPNGGGFSGKAQTYKQFQLYNSGANPVFVAFGVTAPTALVPSGATPGDYPVAPGAVVVVTVEGNPQFVAAIAAVANTAPLYVTPGDGN